MHDPRADLSRLPDETLFNLARNESAIHRMLAIELLVERASPFVGRDEIAVEARQFVLSNPMVLKTIDPAAAAFAPKLPGIVDCLADILTKHNELCRVAAEHHAIHTGNHIAHAEKAAALESTVTENHEVTSRAIAETYSVLWRDCVAKIFHLREDHDSQIAELRAGHKQEITAARERLALLERSLWRRLDDWIRAHWSTPRGTSQ